MSKRTNLTQGQVSVVLKDLTLPMIFGILGIVAFNLADTYFVGKLGTSQMAALTFTFPVVLVINSLNLGLGVGAAAVVSKAAGEQNFQRVKRLSTDSLSLGITFAIIAMIIGYLTLEPLFKALGASPENMVHIKDYMTIWYAGAPFIVIPMIGNATIRALGDTKTPSYVMMISAGLNILFDPIMIFGLGFIPAFGVKGAAIATVCSRSLTFLVSLYILIVREKVISLKAIHPSTLIQSWGQILFIGLPTAFSRMVMPLGLGIVTSLIAGYGQQAVAGYGIASRIEYFALTLVNALSAVIPVYIGQNFGAKSYDRIKEGIRVSEIFSMISGLAIYGLLFILARPLSYLFTDYEGVSDIVVLYLRIVPLAYAAQGIMMILNGALNALHHPIKAASLNIMQIFILYIPLAMILSKGLGLKGIFIGLVMSFIITAYVSHRVFTKETKLLMQPAA